MFKQFFESALIAWSEGQYAMSVLIFTIIPVIPMMIIIAITRGMEDDDNGVDTWLSKLSRYNSIAFTACGVIALICLLLHELFGL